MNQETFSVGISPDFRRVVDRIDEIAIEQQSSRSAVVRSILYDYFGLAPENDRANNWSTVIQERKENM
jgi:metal-responsive CopG/Arc/MetJ family transcriptional regulator